MKEKYIEEIQGINNFNKSIKILKDINNEENLTKEEKEELYIYFLKLLENKEKCIVYQETYDKLEELFETIKKVIPSEILVENYNEIKSQIYYSFYKEEIIKKAKKINISDNITILEKIRKEANLLNKEHKKLYQDYFYHIRGFCYLDINNEEEIEKFITSIKEGISSEILDENFDENNFKSNIVYYKYKGKINSSYFFNNDKLYYYNGLLNQIYEEEILTKEQRDVLYIKLLEEVQHNYLSCYLKYEDEELENLITTIKKVIPQEILLENFNENKLKSNVFYYGCQGNLKSIKEYSEKIYIKLLNKIYEEKNLTEQQQNNLYIEFLNQIQYYDLGSIKIKGEELENSINSLVATINKVIPSDILKRTFDENKLKGNIFYRSYQETMFWDNYFDWNLLEEIGRDKNLTKEQQKKLYIYFLDDLNRSTSIKFNTRKQIEEFINIVKKEIPPEILAENFDENEFRKKAKVKEENKKASIPPEKHNPKTIKIHFEIDNLTKSSDYTNVLKEIEELELSELEKEKIYIYFLNKIFSIYDATVISNKELENLINTIRKEIPPEILVKNFDENEFRKKVTIKNSSSPNPADESILIDIVRKKIYSLTPLNNYDSIDFKQCRSIIEDINKIKNSDAKYELLSELVKELKEYLINAKWFENEEELKGEIEDLIKYIEDKESGMDVNILKENKINLKDIKKKRKIKEIKYLKEITEIEKLDDKIKEKENNIYNRMKPSKLIKILEKELRFYEEEIKKLNKEPEKNKNNIEVYTDSFNEITKEKEILIKNKEYCSSKVLKDIIEKHFEDDYDEIKKDDIIEFEKNIEKEITNLEKEKNSLEKSIKSSDVLQQEYDELKLKLESSKLTIKEESKTIKVFIDNKEIISIKDNHLANLYKDYQKNPEKNERKIKDRVLKLKEKEIQDNENKISRLIEKKSEIESKKEIKKEFDSINELKKQKEAYYSILSDGISQYEEKENDENVNEEIENFVNNHEKLKEFEGYERKDKLKKEIIEQIQEGIKTKPVIFTEGMKSLWNKVLKKALFFATGTVAGFKLSMWASAFPLVREVLLVTSLTKITISTLNKLADKAKQYEETGECKGKKPGKLATGALKLRNKVTGIVSDKKPNLVEKASKMKEKMKQTPINYFLNGLFIGYIAGNIYQMPKGIFDGTKDATNAVVDNATQNAGTVETVTETVTEAVTETVTEAVTETAEIIDFNNIDTTVNNLEKLMEQGLIPKEGTVMDLSSILRGYISSDATSSVALMEEVANDVIFEKIAASPTGELMCHFKQANGLGYSWVKLEDVLKVAGKTLVKTMTK